MSNTSNFLNNAWQEVKTEQQVHFLFLPLVLLLITIPLPFAINNGVLIYLVITTLLNYKSWQKNIQITQILLVVFFLITLFSYFWSIDPQNTLRAIPRGLSFLILPLVFLISPKFTNQSLQKIIKYYSYGMLIYAVFYLTKAIIRFFITGNTEVFFYHELVTLEVNAIHVSVYMSLAFFYFFNEANKSKIQKASMAVLALLVFLLSSKLITIVFVLLLLINIFFYTKVSYKMRLKNLIILGCIIGLFFSYGKIKDRFIIELYSNTKQSVNHEVLEIESKGIQVVSIREALTAQKFSPNHYFPGTAFRAYQARVLFELMNEENKWLSGYGLDGSYKKLEEKAQKYDLYMGSTNQLGYQHNNFHNQYLQLLADVGIFGVFIILFLLLSLFKNSLSQPNFIPIAFSGLMICLFITECFLWRQRGVTFFTTLLLLFTQNFFHNTNNTIKPTE